MARSDTTNSNGNVVFPALSPNPSSGSTAWYTLTVTRLGYQVLPEDVSPESTASRAQLSAGQTFTTVIRVFRPVTLDVRVVDQAGAVLHQPRLRRGRLVPRGHGGDAPRQAVGLLTQRWAPTR